MNGHQARKHSDFAASSSHRWLNCAGSVRACKNAPPQKDSKHSAEGTRAHECLEFIVNRFANLERAQVEAEKKYPAEMIVHAVNAARVVYDLRPSDSAKLLVEARVNLGVGLFGTLDYAWVDVENKKLIAIDFKYGQGVAVYPVDDAGEENSQLMYYATALALEYSWMFESVELVIIQPRIWSADGEIFSSFTTDVSRVRDFYQKVARAVKAAKAPSAPLAAGSWCRWCPAASTCKELSENQMRQAELFFTEEKGLVATPDAQALSAEKLPKILDACDKLELWIDAVRERAFALANTGVKIEGRKLVMKRATRYWLPEAEKEAHLRFGAKVFETKLLSPAQFEKATGDKAFAQEHTASLSSGVTLVKSSDKRNEVESASLFSND